MARDSAGIALATAVVIFITCVVFGLMLTGSGSEGVADVRFGVAPRGLSAFYKAPDPVPDVAPGTLFKSEKVAAPTLHGTFYRVMYASRSLQNQTVVVTGVVIVPKKPVSLRPEVSASNRSDNDQHEPEPHRAAQCRVRVTRAIFRPVAAAQSRR